MRVWLGKLACLDASTMGFWRGQLEAGSQEELSIGPLLLGGSDYFYHLGLR